MEKLIITVAPTGSVPKKQHNPHVPITPKEIIETGVRCEAAGASILHIHARNPVDESPSPEYAIFEETYLGLEEKTNLVLQISNRIVKLAGEVGREVATPDEARRILHLPLKNKDMP